MANFYVGTSKPSKVYVDTNAVKSIYLNETKVWSSSRLIIPVSVLGVNSNMTVEYGNDTSSLVTQIIDFIAETGKYIVVTAKYGTIMGIRCTNCIYFNGVLVDSQSATPASYTFIVGSQSESSIAIACTFSSFTATINITTT